jgi:hypothetical protein
MPPPCFLTGKTCLCVCLCCSGMCKNKPQPHAVSIAHNNGMVRCQAGTRRTTHTYGEVEKEES